MASVGWREKILESELVPPTPCQAVDRLKSVRILAVAGSRMFKCFPILISRGGSRIRLNSLAQIDRK